MQIPIAFFLSLLFGSALAIAPSQSQTRSADSAEVTNQINKTVTLAPGSNVTVRSINGRVNIETWDSNQAEININVKASDTAAMERHPILIDNTPNSLIIRVEE